MNNRFQSLLLNLYNFIDFAIRTGRHLAVGKIKPRTAMVDQMYAMKCDYFLNDWNTDAKSADCMDRTINALEGRRISHGRARLLDWLYVGDVTDADSHGLIKELGITHVLNCAGSFMDPRNGVDVSLMEQSNRKRGKEYSSTYRSLFV